MKNSNLLIKLSCLIPALLISCMVNLSAQNDLTGYTYLGTYFNTNHHYYISNCETTWEGANEAAIEMGGYLAILTENQNADLNSENSIIGQWAAYYVEYDDELTGAWIGLRGENGIYEWTNGETISYESWAGSPVQEPFYAYGAALIGGHHWGSSYWTTYPVTGEAEYIVEFDSPPNCNNNNPNKAYVCHNGNTICVNVTALQGHLDHGDLAGPCGPCNTYSMQAMPDDESGIAGHSLKSLNSALPESHEEHHLVNGKQLSNQMHIYPNPASEQLHVELPEVSQEGTLRILSLTGQEIHTILLKGEQSIALDLSAYASGLYLINVRSANGHYQKKMVKL